MNIMPTNNPIDKSVHGISTKDCTGCMMCGDACAKNAISFPMSNGFWYPSVDSDLCINCGLCSKKCPALHPAPETPADAVACYGAKTKNEDIREHSTSGGFFSELAYQWISEGGVVAGSIYGENQEVLHSVEFEQEGVERLRQSKYTQSKTEGIYAEVKSLLKEGRKVLFCGTPCQVEALNAFLGKKLENLLTMDFICLGICSPLVYRKYLDMLEHKYNSKTKNVWFKNKRTGWRSVGTLVQFENGREYFRPGPWDLYMRSFIIDSLSMRPNCEFCMFRKIPHSSDFTLGDFWGIENVKPEMDDNKGLSAIFVNTEIGYKWVNKIKDKLDIFETTSKDIVAGNFSAIKPKAPHANSVAFMKYITSHSLQQSMDKYSAYTGKFKYSMEWALVKYRIKNYIKRFVK